MIIPFSFKYRTLSSKIVNSGQNTVQFCSRPSIFAGPSTFKTINFHHLEPSILDLTGAFDRNFWFILNFSNYSELIQTMNYPSKFSISFSQGKESSVSIIQLCINEIFASIIIFWHFQIFFYILKTVLSPLKFSPLSGFENVSAKTHNNIRIFTFFSYWDRDWTCFKERKRFSILWHFNNTS